MCVCAHFLGQNFHMPMPKPIPGMRDGITVMGLGSSRSLCKLGKDPVPGHVDSKKANTKTESDLERHRRIGNRFGQATDSIVSEPHMSVSFFSLKKHNIMLLMSLKLEGVTVVVVCVLVF